MAVAGAKTCVVCGTDVSAKPRVKDAQGRYLCKEGACQTKATAASAAAKGAASAGVPSAASAAAKAAAASAPPADGVLDALLADAQKNLGKGCLNCHSPMKKNTMICLNCGFNVEAGKAIRTRVTKEKDPSKAAVAASATAGTIWHYLQQPLVGGALVFLALAVIGAMGALLPVMILPSAGIILLAFIVSWLWGIVDAFRNDENIFGSMMLMVIVVPFVPFILLWLYIPVGILLGIWYIAMVSESSYLKGLFFGAIAANVVNIAVLYFTDAAVFQELLQRVETTSGSTAASPSPR